MEKYYEMLGAKPGCSKRQLKKAYCAALSRLQEGDLLGEQQLEEAYRSILASLAHRADKGRRGLWRASRGTRAYYTGPRGSAAAHSAMQRFGLREPLCAMVIILLSWLAYVISEALTPNLFPTSNYPKLAKTFSGQLVASCAQLLIFIGSFIGYLCYFLNKRTNGLRKIRLGMLLGCALLTLNIFVPQNKLMHTGTLLADIPSMKSGQFSTAQNVILQDVLVQADGSFGSAYTYKNEKSGTVYIPAAMLKDPSGTVHQATVSFLPHTHAAAQVKVRALENRSFLAIGNCFYISFAHGENAKTIYLQRSTAALVVEQHVGSSLTPQKLLQIDLRNIPLKNAAGTPLVNTVTADKISAAVLSNNRLLLTFTAEDRYGSTAGIVTVVDQSNGKILNSSHLLGDYTYKLFSCAGRYYIFTQSPVPLSLTDRHYHLQVYDPTLQKIIYTAPETYQFVFSPHIGSFSENGVWISRHSNGLEPIYKFSVPKEYMN